MLRVFSFIFQSVYICVCACACIWCACECVCLVQGWGWCATPGAIPSFHATWILLEWEVECIQVRWSNKSARFVSSVWNMNIKHIRIMGGSKYVTSVILSDLLVSLGLRCRQRRRVFTRTCEAFRWRSHLEWLSDCNSKTRQQSPTPTQFFWPVMQAP